MLCLEFQLDYVDEGLDHPGLGLGGVLAGIADWGVQEVVRVAPHSSHALLGKTYQILGDLEQPIAYVELSKDLECLSQHIKPLVFSQF